MQTNDEPIKAWDAGYTVALLELDNYIRKTFPKRGATVDRIRTELVTMLNDLHVGILTEDADESRNDYRR